MVQHCCSQDPAWTICLCSHLDRFLMYITNLSFFFGLNLVVYVYVVVIMFAFGFEVVIRAF